MWENNKVSSIPKKFHPKFKRSKLLGFLRSPISSDGDEQKQSILCFEDQGERR